LQLTLHCDRILREDDEPIKGLETLIQKIRSPALGAGSTVDEDMWKVLYTTLFPDAPKADIPDPCK
jgi:hypothetical protein